MYVCVLHRENPPNENAHNPSFKDYQDHINHTIPLLCAARRQRGFEGSPVGVNDRPEIRRASRQGLNERGVGVLPKVVQLSRQGAHLRVCVCVCACVCVFGEGGKVGKGGGAQTLESAQEKKKECTRAPTPLLPPSIHTFTSTC